MDRAHRRISVGRRWAAPAVGLLALAMGSAVLISPAAPAPAANAAPAIASVTPPKTTLAIIKVVLVPDAVSMDIDNDDDTVYVGTDTSGASVVRIFNGRSGTLSGSSISFNLASINSIPGLTVDDNDDTLYASLEGASSTAVGVVNGGRVLDDSFVTFLNTSVLGTVPYLRGMVTDSLDDSVFGGNASNAGRVIKFNGRAMDDSIVRTVATASQCAAGIDSGDDSVYFAGYGKLSIFNGRSWQTRIDMNVASGDGCYTGLVTVNEADDTVYLGQMGNTNDYISVINPRLTVVDDTIKVGRYPQALAVDQADDTVYVAHSQFQSGFNGTTGVSIVNGRTGEATDDTIAFGTNGLNNKSNAIHVDQVGPNAGLVYVLNEISSVDQLSVIGRVSPTAWPPAGLLADDSLTVTVDAPQVTYDLDDAAVSTVYFDDTAVSIPASGAGVGDTWKVKVPPGSGTVQVTVKFRGGLVASAGTFTYGTVAPFAPTLDPLTAGDDTIGLSWTYGFDGGDTVTSLQYATSPSYTWRTLDDSVSPAVISIDSSGAALVPGQTYTVKLRAVNIRGAGQDSNSRSVTLTGTPTPPTPPTPPRTYPPSAPRDVSAVAGDASATVSWSVPSDPGSYPITDYEVRSVPGGASCVVKAPATSCEVGGLTNGTTYTFEVRALNGAGWGSWSIASTPVTPTAGPAKSILITGSRAVVKGQPGVKATGVTVGLAGTIVQARVQMAGKGDFVDGSRSLVGADGRFTWQRIAFRRVTVFFRSLDDPDVRSNRVVIAVE